MEMSQCTIKFHFQKYNYVLKPEQIEVVEWLPAGHDVLSNLPTGFGKKLNLPSVLLGKVVQKPKINGSVLVDSTCNSMVEEQVRN